MRTIAANVEDRIKICVSGSERSPAVGEDWPHVAWDVNMGGLYRILEVARQNRCVLFFPSFISKEALQRCREQAQMREAVERVARHIR